MNERHQNIEPATPSGEPARSPVGEPAEAEPPEADSRLIVEVVGEDEADWSAFGDVIRAVEIAARAVEEFPQLTFDAAIVTIALSSDAEVSELNASFRGKPTPTNVLSFPAGPMPQGGAYEDELRSLGDIILARETVLAEAADLAIPPVHHLQHLVIHGLLHLLGYDHVDDDEARMMETFETRILAGLDIADPYTQPALPAGEA